MVFGSCVQNNSSYDNYEEVINTVLNTELSDINLLITDTDPVRLDSFPDHNTITIKYLELYSNKRYIRKKDISYILDQVKNSKSEKLDPDKFSINTMTRDEIDGIFKSMGLDSAINYLHKKDIKRIGYFLSPLFSKDRSVVIFWAVEWMDPLAAHGYIFIFKRKSNEWKMIEKGHTFVS